MFYRSMSALGAGVVMMLRCHHLSLTMMCCHQVDIPNGEPLLVDEGALQNSSNHTGCVKEEIEQLFSAAVVLWSKSTSW